MDGSGFDDFSKKLSATRTRREAVRLLGSTVAAAALGSLLPGRAWAGGGNSACAHFCASVFGADTPAAGQCTSAAAHGTGLCYTCGPAAPAGHPPVCGQVCCQGGQVCDSSTGTCVTPAPTLYNNVCTCNNGVTKGEVCVTLDECQGFVSGGGSCDLYCSQIGFGGVKSYTCVAC